MNLLKRTVRNALTYPGVRTALHPFRRGAGVILNMHRLADPETGSPGHDPTELRRTLTFLRRRGYELVGLQELFHRLREAPESTDQGVAFTLDDGYADQVRVAGPIFAEFDCPATVFVTTGFLDGALWQWWDKVEFAFESCLKREIHTVVADEAVSYLWDRDHGPGAAIEDFVARCKRVTNEARIEAIADLARAAGVEFPLQPPDRYAPMSWDELQAWEARGMTFGAHSVSHPILSRTSDVQSREEIVGSWNRLRSKARRPVPIFCYPNGGRVDVGPREITTVRELGLEGGVIGPGSGYAEVQEFRATPENPFMVRRFSYPDDYRVVAKYVSGIERILHGRGHWT